MVLLLLFVPDNSVFLERMETRSYRNSVSPDDVDVGGGKSCSVNNMTTRCTVWMLDFVSRSVLFRRGAEMRRRRNARPTIGNLACNSDGASSNGDQKASTSALNLHKTTHEQHWQRQSQDKMYVKWRGAMYVLT